MYKQIILNAHTPEAVCTEQLPDNNMILQLYGRPFFWQ